MYGTIKPEYVQDNILFPPPVVSFIEARKSDVGMSYSASHYKEMKRKIVDSARRLFNRRGFKGVSIIQIMRGAGLTHGCFFPYFRRKGDLYAEVVKWFFIDPEWKRFWKGIHVDLSATDGGGAGSRLPTVNLVINSCN
jgi:hypothetical protein